MPPLETAGVDAMPLATCQLSNHLGYPGGAGGQFFTPEMVAGVRKGLSDNRLFARLRYVITGFLGKVDFASALMDLLDDASAAAPDAIVVVDPVLGDGMRLYLPSEMVDLLIRTVVPRASVITPNTTELLLLAGRSLDDGAFTNAADLVAALDTVHGLGVRTIVLTSVDPAADGAPGSVFDPARVSALVSDAATGIRTLIHVPRIDANFVGTGDLFSGLLVGWHAKLGAASTEWVEPAARAIADMQRVLTATPPGSELRLTASLDALFAADAPFPEPQRWSPS